MILVAGPCLAGSSSVLAALRRRLPERAFVDTVGRHAPAAVIFVASAIAPLVASDCALLDAAAAEIDVVIGAVSKIDVHRNWRDVMAADAEIAAAHDPRYAGMMWVGVAAAPLRGEPRLDDLVDTLEHGLARGSRLLARQNRLRHAIRRHEDAAVGRAARIPVLRRQRIETSRQRVATSEQAIRLRRAIQHLRVELTYFVRARCASVRNELAADAATINGRRIPAFEERVVARIEDVTAEVTGHLSEQLAGLGLTVPAEPPSEPPPTARPAPAANDLETRLMMLLGAVLGSGVALTLSRLFADVARAYTVAGAAVGAGVGLAVAVWVFGMRRTLRDRAALDRWVADVVNDARPVLEQYVITRVLHAESALLTRLARHHDEESAAAAERLAVIDSELGEHAAETARMRRELPALQRALQAADRELNRSCE